MRSQSGTHLAFCRGNLPGRIVWARLTDLREWAFDVFRLGYAPFDSYHSVFFRRVVENELV